MSKLYTTLVMAKQALNDGSLPPMTPVPEKIRHIINPEYVPGLGALNEDAEKGLQCPVCGVWRERMTWHLNGCHKDHGGAAGIKKILEIPMGLSLLPAYAREKQRQTALRLGSGRDLRPNRPGAKVPRSRIRKAAATKKSRKRHLTAGSRNLKNTCHAQIGHRLWDLRNRLGRSVRIQDAKGLDAGLVPACLMLYGTWNAAKASHGLETVPWGSKSKYTRESILECLRAWVDAHGSLPTRFHARTRLPMLPDGTTVLRHIKADTWAGAMRKAAIALGIHDARYRPAL